MNAELFAAFVLITIVLIFESPDKLRAQAE